MYCRIAAAGLAMVGMAGCASPGPASQALPALILAMQGDPAAVLPRLSPEFELVEHFDRHDATPVSRKLTCDLATVAAAGWHVVPDAQVLSETGTQYAPPQRRPDGSWSVALATGSGEEMARYGLVAGSRGWQLARIDVFSVLETGDPVPPSPCPGPEAGSQAD